jgi:glutamyl-tRNA synthetase
LGDIAQWKAICQENLTPVIEDAQFTAKAASLLPEGQWSENTWSQWTSLVKQQTGRKGKELFMPLRLALTGQEHGPELKYLLPLIGKPRAVARLEGKLA